MDLLYSSRNNKFTIDYNGDNKNLMYCEWKTCLCVEQVKHHTTFHDLRNQCPVMFTLREMEMRSRESVIFPLWKQQSKWCESVICTHLVHHRFICDGPNVTLFIHILSHIIILSRATEVGFPVNSPPGAADQTDQPFSSKLPSFRWLS